MEDYDMIYSLRMEDYRREGCKLKVSSLCSEYQPTGLVLNGN